MLCLVSRALQLKACLGMQIVAVPASIANMIFALVKMNDIPNFCWQYYYYDQNSTSLGEQCHNIEVSSYKIQTFNLILHLSWIMTTPVSGMLVFITTNILIPLQSTISHFSSECVVINVALVTISITVAAYCCKVTNCCSPAPKMVSQQLSEPLVSSWRSSVF